LLEIDLELVERNERAVVLVNQSRNNETKHNKEEK